MGDGARALVAHYAQYDWFLAIWGIPLAALTIAGGLSLRSGGARSHREHGETWLAAVRDPAVLALVAFLCAYAYTLVAHEDLVGIDYAHLTAKRFVDMQIWPDNGRFFPLGLQEYNLLALIGKSAWLYHAFSVIELVLVLGCVFRLLDSTPVWLRCVTLASLLIIPGIQESFFALVLPERDLVFWLAVWLVCVQSFSRTKSKSAWYAALVVTQILLYYKETAFTIVGGFAGLRIAAAAWADRDALRRGDYRSTVARHSLEFAMLALCGMFLTIYEVAIRPHVTVSYVAAPLSGARAAEALIVYTRSDFVLDVLLVVFASRMVAVARGKRSFDPLWDATAAGAMAYAFAFIKLGIVREYYLAPTDFVASLYLARMGYDALRAQTRLTIAGAFVAVALLSGRNLRNDAYVVLTRKRFVAANVHLTEFLTTYARTHAEHRLPLFFVQAGGFQLMELSSFLNYKGLHAEGTRRDSSSVSFTVMSTHRYPDARCLPSRDFRCEYAPAPRAGDLVVLLPGHDATPVELAALRATARELMHSRPQPALLERALALLASTDSVEELPSDAYVFEYGPPKD